MCLHIFVITKASYKGLTYWILRWGGGSSSAKILLLFTSNKMTTDNQFVKLHPQQPEVCQATSYTLTPCRHMQTSIDNKYLVPMSSTHQKVKLPPCASQEFTLSFLRHAKGCCRVHPEHSSATGVTASFKSSPPALCKPTGILFSCIKTK